MTPMRNLKLVVLLSSFFLLSAKQASAQVVINEFSSSMSSDDWVELYNVSSDEIDLTGWVIRDTASSPVHEFAGSKIPSGGLCFEEVSNRLNNGGDRIQLFNGSDLVDCVSYGTGGGGFCDSTPDVEAPSAGESASRVPEGASTWSLGTPSKTAVSCESLIPTPTPTPTPTSTPTSSPTPTPTSKPTSTPTPTPKPSSTPTSKPTSIPIPSPTPLVGIGEEDPAVADASGNSQVLGLRDELNAKDSSSSSVLDFRKGKVPILGIVLVACGAILVGASLFVFLKRRTAIYNKDNEETS